MSLAIPAIFAGIAEPLISLSDLWIIGRIPHQQETSIAAVGLVGSFLSAVIWTLAQTKTSLSSIIARSLGQSSLKRTQFLVPQAIGINILLGLLLYVFTAWLAPWIFWAYQPTEEVHQIAVDYYRIRALGYPFTLCSFALFGVFRGLQNTSWAMTASLIAAGLNLGLSWVLVLGSPWTEALGVHGAAYGSLIAQVMLCLIALAYYHYKTSYRWEWPSWRWHGMIKEHFSLTANFFLRTVAINVVIALTYRYANDYGKDIAAVHAVLMNVWLFFSFFIDGFANATNALGGKYLGAKDPKNLRLVIGMSLKYGVLVSLVLVGVCSIGYLWIGASFVNSPAALSYWKSLFWIVLLMQPINAMAFVLDGLFKGWGQAVYLRNMLWLLTVLVFIPVLWLGDYLGWGAPAIYWALFCWMLGRAGVLWVRHRKVLKDI